MSTGLKTRLPRLAPPGKRIWLALAIVLLGLLLAWLDLYDTRDAPGDPSARAVEPGHIIENATLELYDDSGQLTRRITSPDVRHTPQQNTTRLDSPHATLIDNQQRQWHATANTGTLDSQQQRLTLDGEARLIAPEEGWQLDTQKLYYDSRQAHAWSSTPVVLQQPPQRMFARHMDVWLNTQTLRLTDNVRGYHPPPAATNTEETP